MTKIAILYGTTEGQTSKIAQHIAARLRTAGHVADVMHVAELADDFDLAAYQGAILGASIHEGHHQRYVIRWVKAHRDSLARMPTAWFSVCLAINSVHEKDRTEAMAYPQRMSEQTGLKPTCSAVFAGALKYTEYSWLKRLVMKHIVKAEGGSTDVTQDHEYTDWAKVDAFTDGFVASCASA